jgi:hypothetical protein
MNVKKLLLGTVAASGVMVLTAASEPAFFPVVTKAEAAVNVSVEIGFNVFYDRLADHGDWITFRDRYVWVPRVDVGWRPYFHGHWVYTNTYGWYWLSDEPFAWAVYHYGRWAFDPEIGWYWIPGRRWAPAWVVWSHTDDEIAWAPLPPDFDDDDVSVSISVSSVPIYYWQAVPVAFFVSVDLDDHIIRDRDHVRRIVSSGEPKTVVVENNIIVNNVIDINVIEQKSKEKVVVYEEKPAESPDAAGAAEGNTVAVFNPEVKEEPQAKPAKLKKVEEVAAEKKASGTLPQEPAADTAAPAQPAEPSSTEAEAPASEQGKKADQGAEKKAQPEGQAAEEPQTAPEEGQAVTVEEPAKKQKKAVETQEPAAAEEQAEQPVIEEQQQQAEQPAAQEQEGSEKALQAQPEQEPAPAMEGEQAQKPRKKQDQKKQCDPAVEDCPQQ